MADIQPIRFTAAVRYWDPAKGGGLAVADVPAEHIQALGGLRQQRVTGTINDRPFTSSVMPAGGGRLALSVSKQMLKDARSSVGDRIAIEIGAVGRDRASADRQSDSS
jgi:hypothetical protein